MTKAAMAASDPSAIEAPAPPAAPIAAAPEDEAAAWEAAAADWAAAALDASAVAAADVALAPCFAPSAVADLDPALLAALLEAIRPLIALADRWAS